MSSDPTISAVRVWTESRVIPTYEPAPPDRNPMFLEKRVYQGSSGKVYPLPFIDRIAETKTDRAWQTVWIENEFLRVMILPEIGGRIHAIQDKTNGYDLIYHQPVIKPALVGLAGPWVSGGIEFNWPQHHRPSTFMPADFEIEHHADGSVTVWLSEHDPMSRMKGMHGVCLYPGRSLVELKARAYNRTPLAQTFLWWANVATRVHERYQSFFPPDVTFVADHAKRAISTYPLAAGHYYGVDYGARARNGTPPAEVPPKFIPRHCTAESKIESSSQSLSHPKSKIESYAPHDLGWYANIPVPTSYMCIGTEDDFFGGYDHARRAGLIHVANHHIAPGKKQWTWGNHPFGYAWDRNLTDADAAGEFAPYIELMAGVYTDNQPDFSFLQPGETKAWSQYWYPIREIGPAQQANVDAAVSLRVLKPQKGRDRGAIQFGVYTTRRTPRATVRLVAAGKTIYERAVEIAPDSPHVTTVALPKGLRESALRLTVESVGRELISYTPKRARQVERPAPASEPPAPAEIESADELYITGLHLDQYRHATRNPVDYWREALRRDPGDSRCNNALGLWHLRRGEWADAESHFRTAIARATTRNPNPADGEPHYNLGLCLRHQAERESKFENRESKISAAYAAFYKSTWNQAQQPAAFHALAEIDCRRGDWTTALGHLDRALRGNADNLRARDLKAVVLRKLNRAAEADALIAATLALDPLDWWARYLRGEKLTCDAQVRLDLAHDCVRAGLFPDALALLTEATPGAFDGTAPLIAYTVAWVCHHLNDQAGVRRWLATAQKAAPDYCFPARLAEIHVLEYAIASNPRDARAPYYLGNLLYDRRRHREAIACWQKAVRLDPGNAVAWRNLGIGCFNILRQPVKARRAYDWALKANSADARLLFERDQLWKRLRVAPARRLRELERHRDLVTQRDDLTIEFCALLNQTGRHADSLAVVSARRFQPWEGGEGLALGQHVRTHLALGRQALGAGDPMRARAHFEAALGAPENLGEAKHLLANQSDIHFWLGCAYEALGQRDAARSAWTRAATFRGDFQEMSVRTMSEMTYWSARAWEKLGRCGEARRLFTRLLAHAHRLAKEQPKIDYFATSLPTMLLFDDDLRARQTTTARLLEGQALLGLGRSTEGRVLLRQVLKREPSHALAADLLRS
jgi:tetratricopeptide (TPR) repeat protein